MIICWERAVPLAFHLCCFYLYYRCSCTCPLPICCLGQGVEFDRIGSWALPFYLLFLQAIFLDQDFFYFFFRQYFLIRIYFFYHEKFNVVEMTFGTLSAEEKLELDVFSVSRTEDIFNVIKGMGQVLRHIRTTKAQIWSAPLLFSA